jgi:hypothetical protein
MKPRRLLKVWPKSGQLVSAGSDPESIEESGFRRIWKGNGSQRAVVYPSRYINENKDDIRRYK